MKSWADTAPGLLFVLACLLVYVYKDEILLLESHLKVGNGVGQIIFILLLTLAVVLMPLTVMPIIPMAAAVFGPFQTGILSIIGWTIGATLAFLIARYLGRPLLKHFVTLEKYDQVIREMPTRDQFLAIILLRLTMPVDLVSYALGLSKEIKFSTYVLSTTIGVCWFSFAFAYLGEALLKSDYLLLIEFGGTSLIILTLAMYTLKKRINKQNT